MTQIADENIVDLAVIGGGPTGLYAAFYAGLRGLTVKIIDSLEILGGQLATLYPEKMIYDVGGFPSILAKDLAASLVRQAMQHKPEISLGQQVTHLEKPTGKDTFELHTQDHVHRARTVLVAAGMGAFQPKTLPVADAERFVGKGIYYAVNNLEQFRGKRILIVGGGDSAIDWANTLSPLATSVTLIHRRDGFRAHENSVEQMRRGPTRVLTFHELRSVSGNGVLRDAVVYDNRSNEEKRLEIDALLVNIGFSNTLGPIRDWELQLDNSAIRVDSTMQTTRPGVFAAGDIATFPGKLKLIATAFGEACIAVNNAKHRIDPNADIFPGHSSTMKK